MKDINVMVTIIGTGVALATVIVIGQGQLGERFSKVETEIANVRDRVSRIEGLLLRPSVDFLDFSNLPAVADTETESENGG